ncbi:glycosyl hydrolase [Salmonella enterica subsp. enterica]|uniref:Glycosyl hydrolase n=1 Tax=Salmonella enterica I TaxID=59201 RepID=A0A3S4LSY9_SALET|nr:glycosyl hydrolase [Salmonella enterica subsp. enterica]
MNVLEVDLHKLTVSDPFLGTVSTNWFAMWLFLYQWDALNDRIPEAEPSHAIENFPHCRRASRRGDFYGMVFSGQRTWRNGWKRLPGHCARSPIPRLRKPPMR